MYHGFDGSKSLPGRHELEAEELLQNLRTSLGASALVEEAALAALTRGGSLEAPCPIPPPLPSHAAAPGVMSARRRGKKGAPNSAVWWDACQRPQATLDCVELLRASPQASAPQQCHVVQPPLPPVVPSEARGDMRPHAFSADAPEFVPTGSFAVSMPVTSTKAPNNQGKAASGEQCDKLPKQAKGADEQEDCEDAAAMTEYRQKLEASIKSILNQEGEAPSTGSSSPDTVPAMNPEDLPPDCPSVGSLGHERGECRRCNFFHKGRCQNGRSCSFCHFPHEKRKAGRRDAVEAPEQQQQQQQQLQQGQAGASTTMLMQQERSASMANVNLTVKAPPGLVRAEAPAAVQPDMARPKIRCSAGTQTETKCSAGTQTEDDMLPGCSLCGACASGAECKMPEIKARVARLGGC